RKPLCALPSNPGPMHTLSRLRAMMARQGRRVARLAPLALVATTGSCIHIFTKVEARSLERGDVRFVESPVKVHLTDASTVIFENGLGLPRDSVYGVGTRFALGSTIATRVTAIPFDSIAAMESFRTVVRPAPTILASTLASATVIVGSALIIKA